MPARLPAVLEAIYGCYALAWPDTASTPAHAPESLAGEAQYLATTLAGLLGTEPEAWSLAALITLSLSRATSTSPAFVPLSEQDTTTWNAGLIGQGETYLLRAMGPRAGRFQLEAGIQAVHCARARTGATDWMALRTLYTALTAVAPSLGAHVALAAVLARTDGVETALIYLDERAATSPQVESFQPYHATRAQLLAQTDRTTEAAAAFDAARTLTNDPAAHAHLRRQQSNLPRA